MQHREQPAVIAVSAPRIFGFLADCIKMHHLSLLSDKEMHKSGFFQVMTMD